MWSGATGRHQAAPVEPTPNTMVSKYARRVSTRSDRRDTAACTRAVADLLVYNQHRTTFCTHGLTLPGTALGSGVNQFERRTEVISEYVYRSFLGRISSQRIRLAIATETQARRDVSYHQSSLCLYKHSRIRPCSRSRPPLPRFLAGYGGKLAVGCPRY